MKYKKDFVVIANKYTCPNNPEYEKKFCILLNEMIWAVELRGVG